MSRPEKNPPPAPPKRSPRTNIVTFKKGETILRQNELDKDMYLIRSGQVMIFRTYLNHKVELARLGSGEIFGEFSFFDGAPRSATAVAVDDCQLLKISRGDDQSIFSDLPAWVVPVLKCVFSRFRDFDERMSSLMAAANVSRKHFGDPDALELIYRELRRILQIISMTHETFTGQKRPETKVEFQKACEDIIGVSSLSMSVFWNQFDRLSLGGDPESGNEYSIDQKLVTDVLGLLDSSLKSKAFPDLSTSGWGALRQLMTCAESDPSTTKSTKVSKTDEQIKAALMTEATDEMEELVDAKILERGDRCFTWDENVLFLHFIVQSFVNSLKIAWMKAAA